MLRTPLRECINEQPIRNEKMNVPSEQLRKLRHAMSEQTLRKRRLTNKPSSIDLLDQKQLTSFGEMKLNIVEDYFPASPASIGQAIEPSNPSWLILIRKKMRWRWRVSGLLHDTKS